uniref:RCC1 like n=1 Tax=Cairina moschata TaxID=8855 RepID=A0A8C3BPR9_CAIMO
AAAMAALRRALSGAWRPPPPPSHRGFARPAGPPSSRQLREADEAAPVFQYAGKAARRRGRVFVWGFCLAGALGVPSFVRPDAGWKRPRRVQPTPYRLETDGKITSAACGYGFTLLSSNTTDITKVWGMGLNKDSQLGFQRSIRDRTKGYEYVLEPSPIPLPLEKPQQTRVLQVSCGRAHSLILTDSEGVFTMGNNSYGQCGRKIVEDEIYSESHLIHQLNDFDSRVVQVVCGQDHSLFRTEKGTVFACGWGFSTLSLMMLCNLLQVSVPRHLPFKIGKIKEAACGGTGNAVLTEEGNVFVWGYGILGKGPNLTETAVPEMIPPSLFGWSDLNPDVRVAHVRCGLSQFAALTNRGELFVWGKNLRGCLGIGRMEDQYFPWRVTVPGEVVDVACGVDHMVSMVKSFT